MKVSKTVRLDGDLVQWLVNEADRTCPLFQESCRLGVFKISSGRDKKINWNHVKNTVES